LVVKSRQAGYVESISRNRVAMLSVLFISVLFVFVLILVHIAGRRWEAAGRFENIPD
jgi:neurotransmitter:Na+ symporter, NSS family